MPQVRSWSVWIAIAIAALAPACSDSHEPESETPQDAAVRDSAAGDPTPDSTAARSLATSATHACAIRDAGLYCWGLNVLGALGDGTTDDSEAAVHARTAGDDVVQVAAETSRTCVRRGSGEVACWGNNDQGQIGDGTRDPSLAAVRVSGIDDASQLAADADSTCAVHGPKRGVSCWGASPRATPEAGSLVPVAIGELSSVEQLRSSAWGSYCALDSQRAVHCWRIADGAWTAPETIEGLGSVRAIAMPHADYVCALTETEGIVCQGIVDDVRVSLPSSEGAADLVSGSAGLVVCSPDAAADWRCWNVPSFVLASMGAPDVAGLSAIEIASDQPLRELAIAGFRICVLRADDSAGCADAERLSLQAALSRIEVAGAVAGLPD